MVGGKEIKGERRKERGEKHHCGDALYAMLVLKVLCFEAAKEFRCKSF